MRGGNHYGHLPVYNRLIANARDSKAKAREIFALSITDATFWAGGNKRFKKYVLLERLGFPSGMSTASISRNWSRLVQKRIIDSDWNYKLAIILEFGLGLDPRIWIELQRTPDGQLSLAGVARKVNALLVERGLTMHVTAHVVRNFTEALKRENPVPSDSDC